MGILDRNYKRDDLEKALKDLEKLDYFKESKNGNKNNNRNKNENNKTSYWFSWTSLLIVLLIMIQITLKITGREDWYIKHPWLMKARSLFIVP